MTTAEVPSRAVGGRRPARPGIRGWSPGGTGDGGDGGEPNRVPQPPGGREGAPGHRSGPARTARATGIGGTPARHDGHRIATVFLVSIAFILIMFWEELVGLSITCGNSPEKESCHEPRIRRTAICSSNG